LKIHQKNTKRAPKISRKILNNLDELDNIQLIIVGGIFVFLFFDETKINLYYNYLNIILERTLIQIIWTTTLSSIYDTPLCFFIRKFIRKKIEKTEGIICDQNSLIVFVMALNNTF
jgi:hypothetical protein